MAAAEQLWKGQTKAGEEKKLYVMEFLAERGFSVDSAALNAMIEAEVMRISGMF